MGTEETLGRGGVQRLGIQRSAKHHKSSKWAMFHSYVQPEGNGSISLVSAILLVLQRTNIWMDLLGNPYGRDSLTRKTFSETVVRLQLRWRLLV